MVQTTQYGYLEEAFGSRLVVQVGRQKFAAKGKTARITIGFEKLVAGHVTLSQAIGAGKASSTVQAMPYIASTQITQHLTRVVVVSRATCNANSSGATFDYSLYGY